MAKYTTRYASLGFYVGDVRKRFSGGEYVTEDAKEIAVLDALPEINREAEAEPAKTPAAPRAPKPKD
jgi:hypothetical protein